MKHVECATLGDVPDAQVCVDETVERALTLEITCEGAGATAEAVDLSRSGCETSDCFAVEAKRAGATDLLVVRAVWRDGLHLTGVVTNVATGGSHTVTAEDLEKTYNPDWPRSGSQVLALLKWFSRQLALDILSARSPTTDGSPSVGPQPVLVGPAVPVQASPLSGSHPWIGWTLVAAGAVAGGAAGIVWWKDKDLAGCVAVVGDADPCREIHRTIVPAVILGAGAVAAIVAGSVVLSRGRSGRGEGRPFLPTFGRGAGGRF